MYMYTYYSAGHISLHIYLLKSLLELARFGWPGRGIRRGSSLVALGGAGWSSWFWSVRGRRISAPLKEMYIPCEKVKKSYYKV